MTRKDMAYYNQQTQDWETPFVHEDDMVQLAQTVSNISDSVSNLNATVTQHLDENMQYVIAIKNSNQSLPSGLDTLVTFSSLTTNALNDYCEINSDGTIKILKKGIYFIEFIVHYAHSGAGDRLIKPHDVTYAVSTKPLSDLPTRTQATISRYYINANTTLNLTAYQNSGSALDVLSDCQVIIVKVGDLD